MDKVTYQMIVEAKEKLKGLVKETDVVFAEKLSALTKADVYLKLENLQRSGSFKIRGAFNKMLNLTKEEQAKGVIASSAGNHAQGLAIAATKLGIKSTIVMPKTAPLAKISATRNYGGEVILEGDIYDDAYNKALEVQKNTGATFVHPFNDPYVIAGQGTIALEMLDIQPDLDVILVPIGGGGIAAGVALAAKSINPNIKVIGVQAANAPGMYEAIKNEKIETVKVSSTIADGIAVARPGDVTYPIISQYVDEILTITESDLAKAFLHLLESCNIVCEGAGAATTAALIAYADKFKCKKIGLILSGGNIDVTMIESVINHALVALGRRTQIKTIVSHKPGELQKLLKLISDTGANILNIRQNRFREGLQMHQMCVTLVLETFDEEHKTKVLSTLSDNCFDMNLS